MLSQPYPGFLSSAIKRAYVSSVLLPLLVTGCGMNIPSMRPFAKDDATDEGLAESELVGYVKCELHRAVQNSIAQDNHDRALNKQDPVKNIDHPHIDWLHGWAAQVSMKITVDEKSSVAPGLTLKAPMENIVSSFPTGPVTGGQSFALGLGASVSSEATRIETMSFFLPFTVLPDPGETRAAADSCKKEARATIESDLKIEDFIRSKILIADNPKLLPDGQGDAQTGKISPFNSMIYETTFIVTEGGNITPTWSLVHVAANPTAPFLAATRARTDDLTITFGKPQLPTDPKAIPTELDTTARDANLAALIGREVATAIQKQ